MAYPGPKNQFYIIGTNKTCVPNPPDKVFSKVVNGGVAGTVTLKGKGIYKETSLGAVACSDVYYPISSGTLVGNQSIKGSVVMEGVTEETTVSIADSSNASTLKVYRNGQDITAGITKPTFDTITITSGVLSEVLVNGEGDGLDFGDVIEFNLTTNTDIKFIVTLRENDLKLKAGWYAYKADTTTYSVYLAVGEEIEGSFTSIATPNTANFTCKAYV